MLDIVHKLTEPFQGGLTVSGDSLAWRSGGRVTRAALVGDTVTLVVSNREEASLAAARALGLP